MKTLVFSDTHLTNKFEPAKFRFLQKIITSADKVIINGDFWDYYNVTFESFINSDWKELFKLLKSKHTVYIPGNHDKERWMDDSWKVFADELIPEVSISAGSKRLRIMHGDRITYTVHPDIELTGRSGLIVKLNDFQERLNALLFRGMIYGKIVDNRFMKKWAKEQLEENEILVTGHSHWAEYSPKDNFVSLGYIRFGTASYLILEGDSFNLVKTKY